MKLAPAALGERGGVMTTAELREAARAFGQAVDMAARGSGNVNERLVLAYKHYLVRLRPETLPPSVRADARRAAVFLRLHEQVCGWPPGDATRDYTPALQGAVSRACRRCAGPVGGPEERPAAACSKSTRPNRRKTGGIEHQCCPAHATVGRAASGSAAMVSIHVHSVRISTVPNSCDLRGGQRSCRSLRPTRYS